MGSRTQCPACMSTNVVVAEREEGARSSAFQVLPSRRCLDCGTIWEPEASRGWLLIGIVAGLVLLSLGAFAIWAGSAFSGAIAMSLGFGAAAGCLQRWKAKNRS